MAEYHIRWDPTNKKWEVSVDGGAFADLVENPTVEKIKFNAGSDPGGAGVRTWADGSVNLHLRALAVYLEDPASGVGAPALSLVNRNADATGARIYLVKYSGSPAANDDVGGLFGAGYDSVNNYTPYGGLAVLSEVITNGSESGKLVFYCVTAGTTYNNVLDMNNTRILANRRLDYNQPGVLVYNNANITVNTGTATLLTFNTEVYDTDGFHSTSSNTSRLVVPTGLAGYYLVRAHVRWGAVAAATFRTIRLERNSAGTPTDANMFATQRVMSNSDSTVFDHTIQGVVYLNDGDYIECFCGTGANTTATYASGLYHKPPNFGMWRLAK